MQEILARDRFQRRRKMRRTATTTNDLTRTRSLALLQQLPYSRELFLASARTTVGFLHR